MRQEKKEENDVHKYICFLKRKTPLILRSKSIVERVLYDIDCEMIL